MNGMNFDVDTFRANFYDEDGSLEENQAVEGELYELFEETATRNIEELSASVDDAEAWRTTAHELKGAAANLQAGDLAILAKRAEHCGVEEQETRQKLLASIIEEVGVIKAQIAELKSTFK